MNKLIAPDDPILNIPADLMDYITGYINKEIVDDYDGDEVNIIIDPLKEAIVANTKYNGWVAGRCIRRYVNLHISDWNVVMNTAYITLKRKNE